MSHEPYKNVADCALRVVSSGPPPDKEPRSGCGRHSPAVGKEDGVLHPLEVLFTGDSSLLGFLAVFPSPLRTQVAPSYK